MSPQVFSIFSHTPAYPPNGASSVLRCLLDSVEELAELTSIMDHTAHPLHRTWEDLSSSFGDRLLHPQCRKERYCSWFQLKQTPPLKQVWAIDTADGCRGVHQQVLPNLSEVKFLRLSTKI